MASSILPKTRKNCARSISLPARFHPSALRIEDELNKLKTWETTTASLWNAEMIRSGLSGLKDLYDCVEDVLQLLLTQHQAHNYSDEKLVDEVLDGSVRLLDVCDTTRNILMQMKESAKNLQYGLRRRGGAESTNESIVDAYVCSRKKMRKEMLKCIGSLKKMESKFIGSSSPLLLDQDNNLVVVVRVLREVNSITISVFRSLLCFLSVPSSSKPKTISRWSLVSKLLQQKGQVSFVSKEDHEDMINNEVESVDVAVHSLLSCRKNSTSTLEVAQKRLNALEVSIEGLDDGIESLFKCLIKTRVSLLNNFSVSHSRDLIIR
ncbi:Protein of unknown function DUF241 [Macleaya cordata]|uniref:DUF241 domain protein n=1 Tax=Macleaya cordata TaxID=56857 RepID=A0A200QLE3_MACCD|nr:Protein of unknown function DUF241 [Macleaya cordata]